MKKTLLFVSALFAFMLCDAQVKTHSNYDVDGDGSVTVADVTKTVNRVTEKLSDDRTVVDGESLNALLMRIERKLDVLQKEHELVMEKLGISANNSHEYVDLGLSVKWATCNIGAHSPEEYGDYFAWGAKASQRYYDWYCTAYQTQSVIEWQNYSSTKWLKYVGSTTSSYKDSNATDEDALKTVLDPEDDAAHVNWGGFWRMPTKEEQDELREGCYWQWVTSYNGKSINGYIVYKVKDSADKGQKSFNYTPVSSYSVDDPHIFLPAAGRRLYGSLLDDGSWGVYWSSSLGADIPTYAYNILFTSTEVGWHDNGRLDGRSVRAVCP